MNLTPSQIHSITALIEQQGITYPPLIDELTDEAACEIEQEMHHGLSFEHALQKTENHLDHKELGKIQKRVIKSVFSGKLKRTFEFRQSLFLATGLSLWVLLEYLLGRFAGIKEPGPLYGGLFIVIILVFIFQGLWVVRKRFLSQAYSIPQFLLSGARITLYSMLAFTLFLSFFWIVIHPDFYLALSQETDPAASWGDIFRNRLTGMAFAVLEIGIGFTALIVLAQRLLLNRV